MNKKMILPCVLGAEFVLFMLFYYYGVHGHTAVTQLARDNADIEHSIHKIQKEIALLDEQLEQWKSDPFYKEKRAREHLHMVRDAEEVYLL